MNVVRKVAKNTSILFVSQSMSYILVFLYTFFSARYLGPENFGILSFAIAFASIFGIFTDLGLSTLTVRNVSRELKQSNKYLNNVGIFRIIISGAAFFLVILIVNTLNYPEITKNVVYLIYFYVIFNNLSNLIYSIFQAHKKIEYQAVGQIINNVGIFFGVLLSIYLNLNVLGFGVIYLISAIIVFFYITIIYINKFNKPRPEFDWGFLKPLILEAIPLSISLIFLSLVFRVDTVILSIFKGEIAVGYYSAAYRLLEALLIIPTVFNTSIYPFVSEYFISKAHSLCFIYKKSFEYLFIISIPIAVGGFLLSDKVILLIYGAQYNTSITIFSILILVTPIIFLTYIYGFLYSAINKQDLFLKISGLCLLINVTLNLILIPKFSYIGAAVVTLLTEIVSFSLGFHYMSKLICPIRLKNIITKPLIASLIMALVIWKISNFIIIIGVAPFVYFLILFLLKTFDKEDFDLVKKILNK